MVIHLRSIHENGSYMGAHEHTSTWELRALYINVVINGTARLLLKSLKISDSSGIRTFNLWITRPAR